MPEDLRYYQKLRQWRKIERPRGWMLAPLASWTNRLFWICSAAHLQNERAKMPVSFTQIKVGQSYSRNELAKLWGYASMHAIARGVVTPKEDNEIILFVTHEKQTSAEQYENELSGNELRWEGPNDHFAEDRMLAASQTRDEIRLFYRERHHTDFVYQGQLEVIDYTRHTDRPSRFVFRVL